MQSTHSEIFKNPSSLHDPSCQNQVLAFIDELKSSSEGWKMCIEWLMSGEIKDDYMKFLGMQIIEFFLKNNYCNAGQTEQDIIRQFLIHWIQEKCGPHVASEPVFVRNKAAQIFALVCLQDFPNRWPTFFSDLIDSVSLGPNAVDNFLRVLKAVDAEIADREFPYSQTELQRNNIIKNAMRETCVEQIVKSFYDILKSYEVSSPDLVSHCLEILSVYIHWIDIRLVANDVFMRALLQSLTGPVTREAAATCIHSIVTKGMNPLEKYRLIESLIPVLNNVGVFHFAQDDASEFCSKLSVLVNGIGMTLLDALAKCGSCFCGQFSVPVPRSRVLRSFYTGSGHCDGHIGAKIRHEKCGSVQDRLLLEQAIDTKIPIMVKFLGNDYDDVSGAVMEFAKEYIHFLKGRAALTEEQMKNVHQILVTVIHKMKFDSSYQFEHEGEDEAEFQEFRKQLKVIFDNIVGLNKTLVLNSIQELINRTMLDWRCVPFADVEVSLACLYFVYETLPVQSGNFVAEDQVFIEEFVVMVLESGVSAHPHPAVALQFFEVMVRYQKILLNNPSRLMNLTFAFFDVRGMRHPNAKVRSRCAYLFCKFVKGCKSAVTPFAKDMFLPLQELLILNSPVNGQTLEWMSPDDLLFLYEAAGILIISSTLSDQEKAAAFRELLLPTMSRFNGLLKEISEEPDEKTQEMLATAMCQAMSITTRTSKAFTQAISMRRIGCLSVYIECLVMFLNSLQVPVQTTIIQNGVRQFLHRMVVCLDEEILPYIPKASEWLLKNNDMKCMQEYIPLIIQIISKYKKGVLPFLNDCLMPIVSAIYANIAAPLDDRDEDGKVEKSMLKRQYFQFINAITLHCVDALSNQHSLVQKEILMSVVQGAADSSDPTLQKSCFAILKRLIEMWGDKEASDEFVQFILQNVVRLCVEVPLRSTYDTSDNRIEFVFTESAACLKAIYTKRGEEMTRFLKNSYLPSLQMSPQRIEEFIYALKADLKTFKTFLKGFHQQNS